MLNTPTPMPAQKVIDREFLEIRAKILELAASFDRINRGDGSIDGDPRLDLIFEGLKLISEDQPGRAERVQLLFSRMYSESWRDEYGV